MGDKGRKGRLCRVTQWKLKIKLKMGHKSESVASGPVGAEGKEILFSQD